MGKGTIKKHSAYAESCIILTTKHKKSNAIAKPFYNHLKACVIEHVTDTDKFGTFSGEVERKGTALECARKKCEWALTQLKNGVEFVLASEGSFGPHPTIPLIPCNHEILYFIDKKHGFHLHLSLISINTNFNTETVKSWEELQEFSKTALFPSHALILKPHKTKFSHIFKGLQSETALKKAFQECQKYSQDGSVWVETDMRAHLNPSRMKVIEELASMLAERLSNFCPICNTPGWGQVEIMKGLECRLCGSETNLVKSEVYGCVKCSHREIKEVPSSPKNADPQFCEYCNP